MKKTIAVLIAICIFSRAYSQDDRYERIDSFAKEAPESKAISVNILADYLVLPTINDSEKVRAIYTWISSHITYDWDAYKNGTYCHKAPAKILVDRKGVCENFADLFTALCQRAGLEVYTVSGYAKADIDDRWLITGFASENHAWNVVKVYGKWRLIDVTWAKSTLDDRYFMGNPYVFREDHLPGEAKWQLTKDSMTLKQYEDLPLKEDAYETDSISNLLPKLSCIKEKKHVVFEFDSPVKLDPEIQVSNYNHNDKSIPKFTQKVTHTNNHYRLDIFFTEDKLYWVTLSGGFDQDVAKYAVDNSIPGTYAVNTPASKN